MAVKVRYEGLEIDGRVEPFYSAGLHYWRMNRNDWPPALDGVKELGFEAVSLDCPWSVHETARGRFDFGEKENSRDLPAFLKLCGSKGMKVLLRPGPYLDAQLTFGGYPERLFSLPDALARTAEGRVAIQPDPPRFFPIPSYASERFFEEVSIYFRALFQVVGPFLHPSGPVALLQAENDSGRFYSRRPFDLDYSAASVKFYQGFLKDKYGAVEEMNHVYEERHSGFGDAFPPRAFRPEKKGDIVQTLDWLRCRERHLWMGAARIVDLMREHGAGETPVLTSLHGEGGGHPPELRSAERAADFAALSFPGGPPEYRRIKRLSATLAAQSRFPFVGELKCGNAVWGIPTFPEHVALSTKLAFMHGVKGINFHSIADRDRWCGAPLGPDGSPRKDFAEFFKRWLAFLKSRRFHLFQIHAQAALLSVGDYSRLQTAGSLLAHWPFHPPGLEPDWIVRPGALPGMSREVLERYASQWRSMEEGFSLAGYPVMHQDLSAPLSGLLPYKMAAVPTFEFLGADEQKKLLVYALKGGALLLGPRIPETDAAFQPNTSFFAHLKRPRTRLDNMVWEGLGLEAADLFSADRPLVEAEGMAAVYVKETERGKIIHLGALTRADGAGAEGLRALFGRIAREAGLDRPYPPDVPEVETRLHTRDRHKILFAANRAAEGVETTVEPQPGDDWFYDVFTGEKLSCSGGLKVFLPPRSVRVLENVKWT